jgi:5-methylcytosine-specific restriction endonuclease McrA
MIRIEFTPKIKLARWDFANGHCEICHCKIIGGAEYDHDIPFEISQDSSFENCRCLCSKCHRIKTSKDDIPVIAKVKRIERKAKGITRPRQTIRQRNTFKKYVSNTKYVNEGY